MSRYEPPVPAVYVEARVRIMDRRGADADFLAEVSAIGEMSDAAIDISIGNVAGALGVDQNKFIVAFNAEVAALFDAMSAEEAAIADAQIAVYNPGRCAHYRRMAEDFLDWERRQREREP